MLLSLFAAVAVQSIQAPARPPSAPAARPFAGMQFLLGHCWQGRFDDGKLDTHCFEPVYGGALIRDRHEVTGGYAGETIYNWNAAENRADYTYWNTSGGVSRGSMRAQGDQLDFGDEVYRGRDGRETRIATRWRKLDERNYEVRITSAADPTGSRVVRYTRLDAAPVQMREEQAADGTRTLIHEVVVPAPPAEVFRAFATADGWRSWAVPHAWTDPADADLMATSYLPDAQPDSPANIQQRFIARVPDRLILFRTVRTPPGFPHAADYQRVTNLVELEPTGAGTRVRLSGIGYPVGAAGDALLSFFRTGNRTSLEQLRTRFVSGPVDWAARQRGQAPAPPSQ